MLPPDRRLRRGDDIVAAVRRGRRATGAAPGGSPLLVVHVMRGADMSDSEPVRPVRAGFVVSGAVGGAVVRNRVRRRLRHLTRDRLGALPPGSDLVVRALPPAAEATYAELGEGLDRALKRALRGGTPGQGTAGRARTGATV